MHIFVNNDVLDTSDESFLGEVLDRLNLAGEGTAVAVNNLLVPRSLWTKTRLNEADKLIVVRAVAGG